MALGARPRSRGCAYRRRTAAAHGRHPYRHRAAEAAGSAAAGTAAAPERGPAHRQHGQLVVRPHQPPVLVVARAALAVGPGARRSARPAALAEAAASALARRAACGLAPAVARRSCGQPGTGTDPRQRAVPAPAPVDAAAAGHGWPSQASAGPGAEHHRAAPDRCTHPLAHRTAEPCLRTGPHRWLRDRSQHPAHAVDRGVLPHPRPAQGADHPGTGAGAVH